jgi:hypothetical protein
LKKEIKIVKSPDTPDTYDVMYDDKIIKQLYKKRTKFEGQNEYVVIEPSDGSYDDTFIGLKNSKERVKQNVAKQILEDSKQKEKEYLDKLINTIENKDYENFEKIKNHDFENFNLRSKEFKDTLIKYIPKQVDLYRNNAILEQEAIKETLNKPGSSVENLTEDQSVNLKGLVSRSVGQEKGMKAIREIYNDDNFLDILNPDQQKYINNLEYSYVGGVGDLGNPIIPHIFDNPMLEQNQEYMQDYQQKLANLLEKNLGKKFPVYRLMDKKTALAIVTGDLPDIKTLQEDPETKESVLKEYTFEGPFGKQTIPQEFMGFSLSPKEALAFRDFSFSGARGKKDEDFVLMEYTTIPTNAVMRGHEGEKEIVFRTVDSPLSSFELYDIKFTKEEDKRDVQLKKNKDFENLKKRFNK